MPMRSQRTHTQYHALPGTQLSVEAKKTNFAILVALAGLIYIEVIDTITITPLRFEGIIIHSPSI